MLPSEIPWVLYEGSGDRGPFPLVVDGTPISFADVAHIRVTRFATDGTATLLVNGTDYQLSATAALPDLNDVTRAVTAANLTLKIVQPVLAIGEYILIERVAPADQALSYTQAGGFSSSSSERNLDAIVRVIQQMRVAISRGISTNRLDGIPAEPLEIPTVADRADKFFYFDADGNPALASPSVGLGDLISSNNLSDLDSPSAARTNLGLTSLATTAPSSVFFVANNLSEGNAATMRANLGVYSTAQADALITTHVALSDPHTQYARKAVTNSFSQPQTFAGIDITSGNLQSGNGLHQYFNTNVSYIRSLENGVAWRGFQIDGSQLDLNVSSAGLVTVGSGGLSVSGRVTITSTLPQFVISETDQGTDGKNWDVTVNGGALTVRALNDALNSATNLVTFTRSGMTLTTARWGATMTPAANDGNAIGEPSVAWSDAYFATGAVLGFGNGNYNVTHSSNQLAFSGNLKWGNTSQGTLTYGGSNAYIDSSGAIYLRPTSGSLLVVTETALVDRGSAGASLLYVGGANNQGANIAVRANSGQSRGIVFGTGVSSARWYMEATSTAESGGNAGSDFVLSSWTDAGGYLSAPLSITRSTGIATFGAAIIAGGPVRLASYTVAGLPAGSTGDTAYASNGRKNGEGAGAGTGVLVFKDGTAWRACDTGATVAA